MIWRAVLLGTAAALVMCGAAMAQQVTLKIGHVLDPQHPVHLGALKMAEVAAQRSGGRIKIEVYPSSQLGSDREAIQNVQSGTIEGVVDATSKLVNFVPQYAALDLPYLVRNYDEAYRLLDGGVVSKLMGEPAAAAGFRVLSYWEVTLRNVYTTRKPVKAVNDLAGLKIRVIQSPSYVTLFRAFGASPTPMAFGELYTALQQGVVDGAENDLLTFSSTKQYEVAKLVTITNHLMLVNAVILSEKVWQTFPADIQGIITQAAAEGRRTAIAIREEREKKVRADLAAQGVQFFEPDLTPFVAIGRKTCSEFEAKLGKNMIEQVTAAASGP
jgi:tripartite ATP-independent transporter DctP family solute receptor